MKTETKKIDPTIASMNARLGRPLRVLHIGNIANNAYNNAKIQRQYGIEADVICYDYYHIMSCPEWEDSTFTGEVGGNFPDWFATSLKGWSRPEWFVQGPADLCLQYLRARQLKMKLTKRLLQSYLEVNYWRILDDFAAVEGRKRPPAPWHMRWVARLVETMGLHNATTHDDAEMATIAAHNAALESQSPAAQHDSGADTDLQGGVTVKAAETASHPRKIFLGRSRAHVQQVFAHARIRLFNRLVTQHLSHGKLDATGVRMWALYRRVRGQAPASSQDLVELLEWERARSSQQASARLSTRLFIKDSLRSIMTTFSRLARVAKLLVKHLVLTFFKLLLALIKPSFSRMQDKQASAARIPIYQERRNQLISEAAAAGETVQNQVKIYCDYMPLRFFNVLKTYDVIQGYSIDGFIPYMNGLTNFAAYEHGTIRDLPWEPSLSGIVAAKVYREAPLVFVTNSDVLPSVDRLGLDPERVVYLPHAFDDAKLRAFRDTNLQLQPPSSGPTIFFSPTRHHWQDKSGSWTKGNDIMLLAAGELLREGYDFRLVLVEWGNEVSNSKALIETLGLSSKVTWVPTMQKRELWTLYCTSHAVIDQFSLPALGGVGFETMALGRRLITALDNAQMTRFFGCPPPCLIAQTVGECRDRMLEVILDPGDTAGRGVAARQWMIDYHSAERIVSLQARAYQRLIKPTFDPSSAKTN
jgi:glycosyltransferase involved in cell wall biosynthesis